MPPNDGTPIGKIDPVQVPADQAKPGTPDPAPEPSPAKAAAKKPQGRKRPEGEAREFLPAALEILETPANPAGRALALLLSALFVIALAWAYIGEIDIVAVAQGRIVPVGGVKQIQPREIGNVRAIHVSDGQHVNAGDLLIELDPTESEVDKDQLIRERMEAAVEVARLTAYINGLRGLQPNYSPSDGIDDPAVVAMHASRLESDLAAFEAEIASLDAELSRRIADRAAIQAEVEKLRAIIPLMAEREASLLQLLEKGHTPKPVWQEAKTLLIETRHNLTIQGHRLAEAESGMEAAVKERNRMVADRLREAYAELTEARKNLKQSDLALRKALAREELHRMHAPVSGTVQQLAVHTVGGVVQPAEPLMVIVPDDAVLEARAQVLNKDRGFVDFGDAAEIKLEAFNFTKYGTLDGEVRTVSTDAVEDENLGLVYDTRVTLFANSIRADGKDVPLSPGMSVTVEIKTGKRRIIEFLLAPLQRYQDEAIRER
ncbi:MAG: HlyD family type I secretion periplasmic adaptor subunit [Pseudomonadota bacterium]|nr:HlyD family type I secretion periplasmic adaptor subunit [Pseudomonadota bacterium]